MKPITNDMDIIDSQDIIERIEELEDLEKEYSSFSEQDELESLRAMVKQAEGYGDFDHGEALIHEGIRRDKMTPSELKNHTQETNPHFFTRSTMSFFGDTMRNYGVRGNTINGIEVWELYRKRPVMHGLQNSHYFRKDNFKTISKGEQHARNNQGRNSVHR